MRRAGWFWYILRPGYLRPGFSPAFVSAAITSSAACCASFVSAACCCLHRRLATDPLDTLAILLLFLLILSFCLYDIHQLQGKRVKIRGADPC